MQWLAAVAPDLTIECHEYQLYQQGEQLLVSFQRLFPVADLARRLRPIVAAATAEVREQLVTNQRRAKSVTIIHQHQLIPDCAQMTLELETLVKADLVQQVSGWLAADPVRSRITWAPDPNRPLRWAAEPGHAWTPTALRDEIFKGAGLASPSSSAADAWCYDGQSLYSIANSAVEGA